MGTGDVTLRVDLGDVPALLGALLRGQAEIERKVDAIMATQADLDAAAARLNQAADSLDAAAGVMATEATESRQARDELRTEIAKLSDEGADVSGLMAAADRAGQSAERMAQAWVDAKAAIDEVQAIPLDQPPAGP